MSLGVMQDVDGGLFIVFGFGQGLQLGVPSNTKNLFLVFLVAFVSCLVRAVCMSRKMLFPLRLSLQTCWQISPFRRNPLRRGDYICTLPPKSQSRTNNINLCVFCLFFVRVPLRVSFKNAFSKSSSAPTFVKKSRPKFQRSLSQKLICQCLELSP